MMGAMARDSVGPEAEEGEVDGIPKRQERGLLCAPRPKTSGYKNTLS